MSVASKPRQSPGPACSQIWGWHRVSHLLLSSSFWLLSPAPGPGRGPSGGGQELVRPLVLGVGIAPRTPCAVGLSGWARHTCNSAPGQCAVGGEPCEPRPAPQRGCLSRHICPWVAPGHGVVADVTGVRKARHPSQCTRAVELPGAHPRSPPLAFVPRVWPLGSAICPSGCRFHYLNGQDSRPLGSARFSASGSCWGPRSAGVTLLRGAWPHCGVSLQGPSWHRAPRPLR